MGRTFTSYDACADCRFFSAGQCYSDPPRMFPDPDKKERVGYYDVSFIAIRPRVSPGDIACQDFVLAPEIDDD